MKSRLQWQIFRALAVTGVLCALAVAAANWLLFRDERPLRDFATFVVDDLPEDDPAAFERGIKKRAKRLHASITVWDRDGKRLAHAGRRLPAPEERRRRGRWIGGRDGVLVQLGDGRRVAIAHNHDLAVPVPHIFLPLGFLAVALLLGSYWSARRITHRLSQLEASVSRFGQGELAVRAAENGHDEIARLAQAFNRSASRIAGLVRTQRSMLQSASHELRSPLARLRMAIELFGDGLDDDTRKRLTNEAERDIIELDELIDELLLAARLEDTELPKELGPVDLAALARQEVSLLGVSSRIEELHVTGNARMLKTLLRNLLENAKRHGRDPVTLTLRREGDDAVVSVEDAGDGVPAEDQARIFEPFYRAAGAREGRGGGTGLGLALVRSVARHHGGDVTYIAVPHGSRFEARWPVSPQATAAG
jgi:signal transduction histidine kinase